MKKVFLILLAAILIMPTSLLRSYAQEERKTYALILADTPLYRQSSEEFDLIENQLFLLPQSYFVTVVAFADDNSLIQCEYSGVSGFVKADDVEIVLYVPRYIYPQNLTLTIDPIISGAKLYPLPQMSEEELLTVPQSAGEIVYYNYVLGENLGGRGDKWYYVEYNGTFGYLYGLYLNITKTITPNIIEALPEPPVETEPEPSSPIKSNYEYLFIALLCIPALLIIYLLFKGRPAARTYRRSSKYYYDDE